ncbi:DUF4238 domain-containing protein [Kitasatospora hibisci]|uniref:DUF4238 domain-containing protein n=1 Tax=Kitasatospora hibisci TaxID=3369522 RepID=UPI003754DE99
MSPPKRHHFVPQSYLARFGLDDQVRVRRRGSADPYTTNVINVAVRGGFYTTVSSDGTTSTSVEEKLSHLDDAGVQVMREIDRTGRLPTPGSDDREVLCLYLAVQMNRTPEKRTVVLFPEAVKAYAGDRPLDRTLVAEYLERDHLGFAPQPTEVEGALSWLQGVSAYGVPSQNDAISATLGTVAELVPHFRGRHWQLEISHNADFLTSDSPLVLWKPNSKEDAYKGFGLMDAHQIRFPLDPRKQLVLTRGTGTSVADVSPRRVERCNADLADTCEQVIVGHPHRPIWQDKVDLRERGPRLRFNQAPGFQVGPNGRREPMGDIIHHWTSRR